MYLLLISLLLTPSPSHAQFQGKFSGPGSSVMHKSGTVRPCTEIFLNFQKAPSELKLLDGGYNCGDLKASFDPFTLQIRDGKIFSDGAEVGTYADDRLEIRYADTEEDFTYHWLLETSGGEMKYLEEWTDAGAPALTVSGVLKAVE